MNLTTILAVFALVLSTVYLIHYGPQAIDRAIRALTHAVFGGWYRW